MVSLQETAKKYNIKSSETLSKWIEIYQIKGSTGLEVKRTHQKYSREFKLNVVNYYKTHESSARLVAIKFNLNPTQIYSWVNQFDRLGIDGLSPSKRGRKLMNRNTKDQKITQNKESEYIKKINNLKAEIYKYQMENDIIKKQIALKYGINLGSVDDLKPK